MKKLTAFVVATMLSASASAAATVEILLDIGDRAIEVNGMETSTGDHTVRIVVDTDTPNLGSSFDDFRNFYAADVFFDAADLGWDNLEVVSDTFLYFGNSVIGFTDAVEGFSTIYTTFVNGIVSDNFEFDGGDGNVTGFDLSTLDIPQSRDGSGNELRTANDIVFANGDRITDGLTVSGLRANASVGVVDVSEVPLPAGLPLLALGLAGLGFVSRRKTA